jgi:hypothetical protein
MRHARKRGPAVLVHRSLGKHGTELALASAGALSLGSTGSAFGFGAHGRDLDAVHQHIDFRNGLFGNNGQNELFGAVDFLLVTAGDFRANALSRPFDGFGGDFQTRQDLHRLTGRPERHLTAHHGFHTSYAG